MRTWGRVPANPSSDPSTVIVSSEFPGGYTWAEVTTDANGYNDAVWLTTLAQVLQLGLNESPFFGNWGIPAQQTVMTQVLPDYYVTLTQQRFAVYFLALIVSRISANPPTYTINTTSNPNAILQNPVPI